MTHYAQNSYYAGVIGESLAISYLHDFLIINVSIPKDTCLLEQLAELHIFELFCCYQDQ